jgi:uncharacterized protein YlxP (DUF503 family)
VSPAVSAYVAVLVIDLHFAHGADLKGKRKEISSLKAQLHGRLGAAVAEVGHQDTWQRATLTAALTGGSLSTLTAAADRLERFVIDRYPEEAWIRCHVKSLEDFEG